MSEKPGHSQTTTTEAHAKLCDEIAERFPAAPTGRHDDWSHGWQDAAMECAAAIREAIANGR
jgi:hypothetical protein